MQELDIRVVPHHENPISVSSGSFPSLCKRVIKEIAVRNFTKRTAISIGCRCPAAQSYSISVAVGVIVGITVSVAVTVGAAVLVIVGVGVLVGVRVGDGVSVTVGVSVLVGVSVRVGV